VTSNILQTLHQDHANLIQLLSFIEMETHRIDRRDSMANFELISLALEYCVEFPGRYHHPKEDLLYAKLIQRDPKIAGRAADLIEDHETIDKLTREVAAKVADTISGGETRTLCRAAAEFIRHYRYHIGIEETEVFPQARHALTDADWREIENAYEDETDPLFGEHRRQAYIALQQRIVEHTASPC